MISIVVQDNHVDLTVTAPDPVPFSSGDAAFTTLLEADGALLLGDVRTPAALEVLVHDPLRAEAWVADLFGDEVGRALHAGRPGQVPVTTAATLADRVRLLGTLVWAQAWWPAGAEVPPLSQSLLAAETVVATAAVAHLLDDPEAVERALDDALQHPVAAALRAVDVPGLAAAFDDIAVDHGIEVPANLPVSRSSLALVAGGTIEEEGALVEGTASVAWADLPAGGVAAGADAHWSIALDGSIPTLRVSISAAPTAARPVPEPPLVVPLVARFGPDDLGVEVALLREGPAYVGAIEVPFEAVALPTPQRSLRISRPDQLDATHDSVDPSADSVDPSADTADPVPTLVRVARERLARAARGDSHSMLAERVAAGSRDE